MAVSIPNDGLAIVRAAFGPIGADRLVGARTADVTIRDVAATLVYRLDAVEHARRCAIGLRAVTRIDWLDCLLHMPVGQPMHPDALTAGECQIIRQLPRGCVRASGVQLIREIVRPVAVDAALIVRSDWRAGMFDAGSFSSYCTRIVAVAGIPDKQAEVEADYYGIGLIINAAVSPEVVVPPQRFSAAVHSAAGWSFAERTYREVTAC